MSTPHATRMWFTPKQIKTNALHRLVQNNRNRVERELATILLGAMEQFDSNEVHLCPLDALQLLNRTRIKTDLTQLRRILKKDWRLENQGQLSELSKACYMARCLHAFGGCQGTLFYS